MLPELDQLDERIAQLTHLCAALRSENAALRARVAGLEGDNRRLGERMDAASGRIASLLERLPA